MNWIWVMLINVESFIWTLMEFTSWILSSFWIGAVRWRQSKPSSPAVPELCKGFLQYLDYCLFTRMVKTRFSLFTYTCQIFFSSFFSLITRAFTSGSRLCFRYNMDCFYRVLQSIMLEGGDENVSVKHATILIHSISHWHCKQGENRTVKSKVALLHCLNLTTKAKVHV